MQNYKKISTFASIMKVNIEKRLSAYHFIALLRRYPLSYHRYMDSLFHECARHTTEPRHAH